MRDLGVTVLWGIDTDVPDACLQMLSNSQAIYNLCITEITNLLSKQQFHLVLQVATTLLVAGPTLTLWIPGQTLFASTSSYSRLVQRLALCIM